MCLAKCLQKLEAEGLPFRYACAGASVAGGVQCGVHQLRDVALVLLRERVLVV